MLPMAEGGFVRTQILMGRGIGQEKPTSRSSSLDSSIKFIADSFRHVRPRVSMNVLCVEISADTRGTGVWYLTFLFSVTESVTSIDLRGY